MSLVRYTNGRRRGGERGLSNVELGLSVAVIFGLAFVTARIMAVDAPAPASPMNGAAAWDAGASATR